MENEAVSHDEGSQEPVDEMDGEVVVHVVIEVLPLELAVVVVSVHSFGDSLSVNGVDVLQHVSAVRDSLENHEDQNEQVTKTDFPSGSPKSWGWSLGIFNWIFLDSLHHNDPANSHEAPHSVRDGVFGFQHPANVKNWEESHHPVDLVEEVNVH